jgi:NitT/TauT family transport system permease protein
MTTTDRPAGAKREPPGSDRAPGSLIGRRPRRLSASAPRRLASMLLYLVYYAVLVGIWQALIEIFRPPSYIYPSPVTVAQFLGQHPGYLWEAVVATGQEILLGFAFGLAAGAALAFFCDAIPLVRRAAWPLVVVLQMIPKIALAPWFLLIFGIGLESKVILVVSVSFFPMFIDTLAGLEASSEAVGELSRSMRMTLFQTYRLVKVPGALPQILSGAKVGMSLAVIGAVVAEFISSDRGLGFIIVQAQGNSDAPALVGSVVVLTVLGYVLFCILTALERLLIPWHVSQRRGKELRRGGGTA